MTVNPDSLPWRIRLRFALPSADPKRRDGESETTLMARAGVDPESADRTDDVEAALPEPCADPSANHGDGQMALA